MEKRRVVITGIGGITPLASNIKDSWKELIKSKSAISTISVFDASDMDCRIAAEIKQDKYPDIFQKYIDPKDEKKMDLFIKYAMVASGAAIEDSNLDFKDEDLGERTGVLIGSGIGGLIAIENSVRKIFVDNAKKVTPFFIPSCLINLASGHVSIKYGLKGPNQSIVTACATGAHSIGEAAKFIRYGEADVMIAGGAEATICKTGIIGFASCKTLSTKYNENPPIASRPWDKGRDGFVMGEGAGILVLEEYEHAKKRGAHIYAELVGYGLSGDAYHITSLNPEGTGCIKAMKGALKSAELGADAIDYINAHGTSTPLGDIIELRAVQSLFDSDIAMSSNKSSIGHLLGAAGSVEAIFSILAIQDQIVPPTLNLDDPEEEVMINLVPHFSQDRKVDYVLSNSFGFGGTNACLIFKKI